MLSLAVQCIVIGPVCGGWAGGRCLWMGVWVGLLPCEIACIDLHQTGLVGKGSDHLQLIKFWPSRAPGRGSAGGENFWLRLTTASAQCLLLTLKAPG